MNSMVEITDQGTTFVAKKVRTNIPTFELAKNLARANFNRSHAILAIAAKGHDIVTSAIILKAAEALTMFR